MKKVLFVFAFIVCGSFAVAQDATDVMLQRITKLTLENDSLQREIANVRKRNNERISIYNDSIVRLNEKRAELNRTVSNLRRDLETERKKAEKVKDVKRERDSLIIQNGELFNRLERERKEQYEAGRKSVLSRVEQAYNLDFDVLAQSVSLQAVQRDMPFVEDAVILNRMKELQAFLEAQRVLSEKYDEQKVAAAQAKIKGLTQTNMVKALGTSLASYGSCYNALKETIGKINKIDDESYANTDKIKKEKTKDILAELSDYFYNYSFDFAEYPYLTGIVMEIINRKQRDANADISDLMVEPVKPNSNVRIKPVKP